MNTVYLTRSLLGLTLAISVCNTVSYAEPASSVSPTTSSTPSMAVTSSDVSGVWRSFDDKTGYAKSLIKIEQNADGSYGGSIIKVLTHEGYTPQTHCQNCPAPYTGKPIEGLHILWGLKANSTTSYSGGKILDPLSGRIYSAKIALAPGGKTLTLRGYLGISMLGRSQVWTRE